MQKHVNLVDLVKSFPTNIFLQNLASIQKRTSSVKFAHLAEKSMKSSISNLSTRVLALQDQGRGDDCLDLPGRNCGHRRSDVRETEPLSRWKSDHFAPALLGKKKKKKCQNKK